MQIRAINRIAIYYVVIAPINNLKAKNISRSASIFKTYAIYLSLNLSPSVLILRAMMNLVMESVARNRMANTAASARSFCNR